MRVRCLSLFAEYIDQIADGTKTAEFRSYKIEPGPLALATNKKSGRAELRLLVDIVGAEWSSGGEEIDGIWYEHNAYANQIANVRHLRRDAVVEACFNCAAGRRDTHAGIFYVEASLASAPARRTSSAAVGKAVEIDRRVNVIRPPTPTASTSPLTLPSVATRPTALRPVDPFAIKVPTLLERAIAEFGDTPEVRALFGEE